MIAQLSEELNPLLHGAKAKGLSRLMRAGFRVPAGVVLSTKAFFEFERHTPSLEREVRVQIEPFLTQLGPSVMVRSSAVGEDGEGASFAGQLESFISPSDWQSTWKHIQKCWQSYRNDRVEQYQKTTNEKLLGMAVIVQKLIDPEISGVLFSADPQDESFARIEWVEGHAEKLVQGQITPHEFRIHRSAIKNSEIFCDLLQIGQRVECLYGAAQDIEWAIHDQKVYLVQTRPITRTIRRTIWSNTNLNENYPDKIDILLASIARESYYHYFKNLAKALLSESVVQASESDFRNSVGIWKHRIYYNLTAIHSFLNRSPLGPLLKKSFDDFVGHRPSAAETPAEPKKRGLSLFLIRLLVNVLALPLKVRRFEKRTQEYAQQTESAQTFTELRSAYWNFLRIRFYEWTDASFADFSAMLLHGMLGKIAGQSFQNRLVQGIPDLISKQPIHEMWNLHQLAQASSWQDHDVKIGIKNYIKNWGFRCSGELLFLNDNFIDRPESFIKLLEGYSSTSPKNPKVLFQAERREFWETQRLLAFTLLKAACFSIIKLQLRDALNNILKLWTFSILAGLARYSISCRERVRLKQALIYDRFKRVVLALERHLQKKHPQLRSKDLFFLSFKELDSLFSEADFTVASKILDEIADRRTRWQDSPSHPDHFVSYGYDDSMIQEIKPHTVVNLKNLVGIPASRGIVTGRAVVIRDIHEAHRLQSGDVLVTKQTDPGWICVFPIISGLVIENGGMLSHGAIVAREFGISAVVGVANATLLIHDGDQITLDGDQGTVCLST